MTRLAWALVALLLVLGGAFLSLRTPDIPLDDLKARYASPASQFVELSPGFTVHLRDEGPRDAPALLLLHGSNASLHTWEPWVERLAKNYRVVTLDLQGHGLTGPMPNGCYTSVCMADTVEAVRARLGLETIALAGNSMGGGVAIAYSLEHPQRVSALILVDSGGAPVRREGRPPIGFRIAQTPLVRDIGALITPRSMIATTLDKSVSVKSVASDAAVDRYWELLRAPGNREATMQRFAAYGPSKLTPQSFARLADTPVLILWGEEDALIPVSAAEWFAAAMPWAKLLIYPGIGHLPQEEAAERSAADVRAFLAEQGIGAAGKLQAAG